MHFPFRRLYRQFNPTVVKLMRAKNQGISTLDYDVLLYHISYIPLSTDIVQDVVERSFLQLKIASISVVGRLKFLANIDSHSVVESMVKHVNIYAFFVRLFEMVNIENINICLFSSKHGCESHSETTRAAKCILY